MIRPSRSDFNDRRAPCRADAAAMIHDLISPGKRGNDHPGMKVICSWRQLAAGLGIFLWLGSACSKQESARPSTSAARESRASRTASVPTNGVPRIRIEISRRGMDTLGQYRWAWGGNHADRSNVLATVREGDAVYRNVTVHLKGGAGSFRSLDQKPAFTLNFDKFEEGQRFHGLKKIHLNNSVQDQSYL